MFTILSNFNFDEIINMLIAIVTALGAGLAIWGGVNLMEGYGNDNPGARSQGIKQLVAGGGVIVLAQFGIKMLIDAFAGYL